MDIETQEIKKDVVKPRLFIYSKGEKRKEEKRGRMEWREKNKIPFWHFFFATSSLTSNYYYYCKYNTTTNMCEYVSATDRQNEVLQWRQLLLVVINPVFQLHHLLLIK